MKSTKLKATREASGKTQVQVAAEVGIALRGYQNYESGSREPRIGTALKIADALGVDVRELFKS